MVEGLDWNMLVRARLPWAHFACCAERGIDEFVRTAPTSDTTVVRIIRGKRCTDSNALFHEWAAALQFPYYFGENWDGFEECLGDIEWLPATSYLFFLTHTSLILRDAEEGFAIFIDILKRAAIDWNSGENPGNLSGQPSVSFHIVFHSEPEDEKETRTRLGRVNVDCSGAPEIE